MVVGRDVRRFLSTCRPWVLALVAAVTVAPAQTTVSAKDAERMVTEYLLLDEKNPREFERRTAILDRLRTMPALRSDREVADWSKKIAKVWKKGRTLSRSGEHWFFGDEEDRAARKGRYLVAGDARKPKGLLIAMHGGGKGSGDAQGAFSAYQAAASRFDWIVIAPEVLERTEHGWTDSGTEEFVLDLVDAALRTWPIDPDHVFFAGHSMGGYGSWTLGAHHADRVAAVAPAAGAPTPILERTDDGPKIVDIAEGVIPNLRNVFVAVYQSTDDVQVPPEPNQIAVQKLIAAREQWGAFEHDYWEVDGRGHGAPPGGHVAQLEKIAKRSRITIPERIVWQPTLSWKRQFYWLYWEQPKSNALIVADLDRAANTVRITTESATDGLWVLVDPRVLDPKQPIVVMVNDTEVFRGSAVLMLADLLLTSGHPDPKLSFPARVPAFVRKD